MRHITLSLHRSKYCGMLSSRHKSSDHRFLDVGESSVDLCELFKDFKDSYPTGPLILILRESFRLLPTYVSDDSFYQAQDFKKDGFLKIFEVLLCIYYRLRSNDISSSDELKSALTELEALKCNAFNVSDEFVVSDGVIPKDFFSIFMAISLLKAYLIFSSDKEAAYYLCKNILYSYRYSSGEKESYSHYEVYFDLIHVKECGDIDSLFGKRLWKNEANFSDFFKNSYEKSINFINSYESSIRARNLNFVYRLIMGGYSEEEFYSYLSEAPPLPDIIDNLSRHVYNVISIFVSGKGNSGAIYMHSLSVSSTSGSLSIQMGKGEVLFIVGANGVGKSALAHKIYTQNPNGSKRISANRRVTLKSNSSGINSSSRTQLDKSIEQGDLNTSSRYTDSIEDQKLNAVLYDLVNQENVKDRTVAAYFRNGDLQDAKAEAEKNHQLA